ncbi:MAG TPA: Mut7-C RNAse domain-containing protein [Dissulfurispiraceae bacterium]|nr:Mut7-C RNAse domain-containing protein [Dissulfurispiraceae bacterium]
MCAPRFVSDVMLGSLSKWLRILGFDTLYFRRADDHELIRIALREQRTLITRDSGLARRCSRTGHPACISIISQRTSDQVREVLSAVSASLPPLPAGPPRCVVCNGELSPAGRESVFGDVPEFVYRNRDSFFRCLSCGKVYWEGSHSRHIEETISRILGDAGQMR